MPAGTVVASGSLVSPGGQQGIQGVIGPTGAQGTVSGFSTLSSAYNLTSGDTNKYLICSGGSWILGLPTPAAGLNYRVRNDQGITGTTGTITITPASGTIDGAGSLALLAGQEVLIITNGSNWRTFGRQRVVVLGTQDIASSTASAFVLLPVGYRYFELEFMGWQGAASSSSMLGRMSIDGGSSWLATGYYGSLIYNSSSATPSALAEMDENIAYIYVTPSHAGGFSSGIIPGQARIKIYPGNALICPTWMIQNYGRVSANGTASWLNVGCLVTAGPINAFQYYANTGNMSNSSLTVKGIV